MAFRAEETARSEAEKGLVNLQERLPVWPKLREGRVEKREAERVFGAGHVLVVPNYSTKFLLFILLNYLFSNFYLFY